MSGDVRVDPADVQALQHLVADVKSVTGKEDLIRSLRWARQHLVGLKDARTTLRCHAYTFFILINVTLISDVTNNVSATCLLDNLN